MIKKENIDWKRPKSFVSNTWNSEHADNLLKKRQSPPTDSSGNLHESEDKEPEVFCEISERLNSLMKKARTILQSNDQQNLTENVIGILEKFEENTEKSSFSWVFSDETLLQPSKHSFSPYLGVHHSEDNNTLYKILEKPINNFNGRNERNS